MKNLSETIKSSYSDILDQCMYNSRADFNDIESATISIGILSCITRADLMIETREEKYMLLEAFNRYSNSVLAKDIIYEPDYSDVVVGAENQSAILINNKFISL